MELLLLAQLAQPVPKLGSCPYGYYTQGSYCVPARPAPPAIERDGQCPFGWYSQGYYCRQSR
jgi:hypothetical protein